MSKHNHLWNDMSLDERKRLAPYMLESQILHLRQARGIIVRAHAAELRELDEWIKNCERSLRPSAYSQSGLGLNGKSQGVTDPLEPIAGTSTLPPSHQTLAENTGGGQ